jgi:hypothetical protein
MRIRNRRGDYQSVDTTAHGSIERSGMGKS